MRVLLGASVYGLNMTRLWNQHYKWETAARELVPNGSLSSQLPLSVSLPIVVALNRKALVPSIKTNGSTY